MEIPGGYGPDQQAIAHAVFQLPRVDPTSDASGRTVQGRRTARIRRVRARAKAFDSEVAELRAVIESHGTGTTTVGWATRAVYASASLEGLAAGAELEGIESMDVMTTAGIDRAEGRKSYRSSDVSFDGWIPGHDGSDVLIGVLDDELAAHPWLKTLEARQFTAEPLGTPGRHATMVAGLIAADHDSYRGAAPGATVRGYKIVASIRPWSTPEPQLVDALQSAVLDGMDIVNCSFNMTSGSDASARMNDAMATFVAEGVIVVKSAGNDGGAAYTEPWQAPGLIVVGACDRPGTAIAPYSNGGSQAHHPGFLIAPGGVKGAPLVGLGTSAPNLRTDTGTSYAAAIVSGLAACALQETPGASPADVLARLSGLATGPLPAVTG
jgi:subtilisin family serine protease